MKRLPKWLGNSVASVNNLIIINSLLELLGKRRSLGNKGCKFGKAFFILMEEAEYLGTGQLTSSSPVA